MIGFIKVCIQNSIILYYVTARSDPIELQHTTMTSDPIDMPPGSIRTLETHFVLWEARKIDFFRKKVQNVRFWSENPNPSGKSQY
jgi:hypothetical protein